MLAVIVAKNESRHKEDPEASHPRVRKFFPSLGAPVYRVSPKYS